MINYTGFLPATISDVHCKQPMFSHRMFSWQLASLSELTCSTVVPGGHSASPPSEKVLSFAASWWLQAAKEIFFFSLSFFPFANEIFFLNLVLENMTLGIKIEDKSDLWVSSSLSQSLFLIKTTPLHQHLQCKQLLCWLRTDSVQFSFLARIGGTSLGEKKHFYQQMSKTHRESGLCITACSIDKQSSFKFWHCTSKINMQ